MDEASHALEIARGARRLPKLHVGALHSSVAGRTDHLPTSVPSGAYVIPADIVSGLGEGNTIAGFKHIKRMFKGLPYSGESEPYGQSEGPYGMGQPHAKGGTAQSEGEPVPVVLAGGEYVLPPKWVAWAGDGDMETGHRVLDKFVVKFREKLVKTLKGLPGPRKD